MLILLRGSLPTEASKAAILQRAQELYGATPGNVVDELAVDPRGGPAARANNIPQVLPILKYMAERSSIIIDGRTIVLSGRADGDRAKAILLRDIAPLTQAGLELEDRILTSSFLADPSSKVPSLAASPSSRASSLPDSLSPAAPSVAETRSFSLQKKLDEILARTSIEFESNSTTMTPSSLSTLDHLIAQLRPFPRTVIEIGGHTDKYGKPDYNLQLSRRRAEAVRRYFINHGLAKQFTAVGYGDSRPLSVAEKRSGLLRNRRIELQVKGQTDL